MDTTHGSENSKILKYLDNIVFPDVTEINEDGYIQHISNIAKEMHDILLLDTVSNVPRSCNTSLSEPGTGTPTYKDPPTKGGGFDALDPSIFFQIVETNLVQHQSPGKIIDLRNQLGSLMLVNKATYHRISQLVSTDATSPPPKTIIGTCMNNPSIELKIRQHMFDYIIAIIVLERRRLAISKSTQVVCSATESDPDGKGRIFMILKTRANEAYITFIHRLTTIRIPFNASFVDFATMPDLTLAKINNLAVSLLGGDELSTAHQVKKYREKWARIGVVHCESLVQSNQPRNHESLFLLQSTFVNHVQDKPLLLKKIIYEKVSDIESLYGALVYNMGSFRDMGPPRMDITGMDLEALSRISVYGLRYTFCDGVTDAPGFDNAYSYCVTAYIRQYLKRQFKPINPSDVDSLFGVLDTRLSEKEEQLLLNKAEFSKLQRQDALARMSDINVQIDTILRCLHLFQIFTHEEMVQIYGDEGAKSVYKSSLNNFKEEFEFLGMVSLSSTGTEPIDIPRIFLTIVKEPENLKRMLIADKIGTVHKMKRLLHNTMTDQTISLRWMFGADRAKGVRVIIDTLRLRKTLRLCDPSTDVNSVLKQLHHIKHGLDATLSISAMNGERGDDVEDLISALESGESLKDVKDKFDSLFKRMYKVKDDIEHRKLFKQKTQEYREYTTSLQLLQTEQAELRKYMQQQIGGLTFVKMMGTTLQNTRLRVHKPVYTSFGTPILHVRHRGRYISVDAYKRLKQPEVWSIG
jgi:hypothetical protein